VAFIGRRSGESLQWRHISRNIEGHNIEDKIHCTVSKLDEAWLKSSFAIYHYGKVQQVDDICQIRRVSWGVSEIKCIIFKENNDNSYETKIIILN
jgi:hypothetical protein